MKYQCIYLVSSLLFVSTCLFVSPVYAVSDLLEASVKNITSKSVEISFTPFQESKSSCVDNGFWYNYRLLNGEKKVLKTGLNSTPYFELYDLKPNTDYTYYIQAVKIHIDDKNYCGRSRAGTSVSTTFENVAISNQILVTTKPSASNTSDELEVNDYVKSPFIFEKYAYISAQFSYRAFTMDGKPASKQKKFSLDVRYDSVNDSLMFLDLSSGDVSREYGDKTFLRLFTNNNGLLSLHATGGKTSIFPLDKKISVPKQVLDIVSSEAYEKNSFIDLTKRGQKMLVYDYSDPNRYYVIKLISISKSTIAPPYLATPYGGVNSEPVLLWSENTYSVNSIKNVLLEYYCSDCEEKRLRKIQQVSIPFNSLYDNSSYASWQHYDISEKKDLFLNKTIWYRVRTYFSSGQLSPWTIWTNTKVVESLPAY